MIHINQLIIMLPLISATQNNINVNIHNKFAESIDYNVFSTEQPKFKNTIEYNTMTMQEMLEDNNNKIIQHIYKTLE